MSLVARDGGLLMLDGGLAASDDPCLCCETPCGTSAASGGAGTTINTYKYPSKEGEVEFFYDAYSVPDAFKVEGGGQVFVDTGSISGSATIRFCKPEGVTELKVTVTGPDGTAWEYYISCPDNPCSGGTTITNHESGLDHEPNEEELAAQVALLNARYQVGLGDVVERVLKSVGITQERVTKLLGRPCGCPERKRRLNQFGAKLGIRGTRRRVRP